MPKKSTNHLRPQPQPSLAKNLVAMENPAGGLCNVLSDYSNCGANMHCAQPFLAHGPNRGVCKWGSAGDMMVLTRHLCQSGLGRAVRTTQILALSTRFVRFQFLSMFRWCTSDTFTGQNWVERCERPKFLPYRPVLCDPPWRFQFLSMFI